MAWYRVGGGGLPNSVKTDMNNVLNKKLGTSTTYPVNDWATEVNLMGMLEEKTVSSSPIVTFPDGADAVPLKKCEVTLPASLDGYSEIDVVSAGKNVLEWSNTSQTVNQVTFTVNSNGTITVNGTATGGDASFYATASTYYAMKAGTYKISGCPTGGSNTTFFINEITKGVTDIGSGATLTLTENANIRLRITIRNGYNADNMTFSPMIELGENVTTFEPYSGTTHTASLGRTIYGGTANVVKGQGESGYGKVDLGTLTWTKRNTSSGHWRFTTQDVPVVINDDSSHIPSMDCIEYTAISPTQSWNGVTGVTCNIVISQLMVCDETYETASDFTTAVSGVYLVYPLATPETFTFTPITPTPETALGVNNFWADEGDSEVTYRAQGTVTVYPNAEEASF